MIRALALLLALASPASAEVCADRGTILKELQKQYGEAPVIAALTEDGRVVEFVATPDGGSWTLLITRPDGTTCALGTGVAWARGGEAV